LIGRVLVSIVSGGFSVVVSFPVRVEADLGLVVLTADSVSGLFSFRFGGIISSLPSDLRVGRGIVLVVVASLAGSFFRNNSLGGVLVLSFGFLFSFRGVL